MMVKIDSKDFRVGSNDEKMPVVHIAPEILHIQASRRVTRRERHLDKSIPLFRERGGHLFENGTRIVKIFFDLSKDEQRKRVLERIDEPDKN